MGNSSIGSCSCLGKRLPLEFFFCQGQESGLVFLCEQCLKLHNHLVIDIIM